jgi:hypothetical protein
MAYFLKQTKRGSAQNLRRTASKKLRLVITPLPFPAGGERHPSNKVIPSRQMAGNTACQKPPAGCGIAAYTVKFVPPDTVPYLVPVPKRRDAQGDKLQVLFSFVAFRPGESFSAGGAAFSLSGMEQCPAKGTARWEEQIQ